MGSSRDLSTNTDPVPHQVRTATEPRQPGLHSVTVSKITRINDTIKTFRLDIDDAASEISFRPGQWLDVHFPRLDKAGGYTIISTPKASQGADESASSPNAEIPHLELAVQDAETPQVKRLWDEEERVIGMKLHVRVGGSFVWPPEHLRESDVGRVIFLAGGVGINPLISMASHMHETDTLPGRVDFLYSTRVKSSYKVGNILSLRQLLGIAQARPESFGLQLFMSGHPGRQLMEEVKPRARFEPRRLLDGDVMNVARGMKTHERTVWYICGPPQMTDHFVDLLKSESEVGEKDVLCEKWW